MDSKILIIIASDNLILILHSFAHEVRLCEDDDQA